MGVVFTDGCPGGGPCEACGIARDTRFGICFDCACNAERVAAHEGVLRHLSRVPGRLIAGDWFGAKTRLSWAWERLTKTGDYRPGGEFDRQYFNPPPKVILTGPAPGDAAPRRPSSQDGLATATAYGEGASESTGGHINPSSSPHSDGGREP